ncbi:MAG: PhoH family protein [Pseudomonadales bacterium]|nr:PhoH family protein [Pseudomonadales bacterium]
MNAILQTHNLTLEPYDTHRLTNLCGQFDEHLRQIEKRLHVQINNRGNLFQLVGETQSVNVTVQLLDTLYQGTNNGQLITPEVIHLKIRELGMDDPSEIDEGSSTDHNTGQSYAHPIKTRRGNIKARGENQKDYLLNIQSNDINFGIGPAGTGKTYLAVASAVDALERDETRRILLVRPAVEAGEKLGFLPGDLSEKINPYLRPLYDALYEMLGFERVGRLIERHIIEVAPLAYMRGRTLNNSFIILDESQNTTREQMKMFLTRIGFGSKAVITGDHTQVDLPRGTQSGLNHAMEVLDGVDGIGFTHFSSKDVVRHVLVQRIVEAYDRDDKLQEKSKGGHVNPRVNPRIGDLQKTDARKSNPPQDSSTS